VGDPPGGRVGQWGPTRRVGAENLEGCGGTRGRGSLRQTPDPLSLPFRAEAVRVAEVPVVEAVQEPEAGDSVQVGWDALHSDNRDGIQEAQRRNLNLDEADGELTREGPAERHLSDGLAPRPEAIWLDQYELKHGLSGAGTRVGDESANQGRLGPGQRDLDVWPVVCQRTPDERHESVTPQMTSTRS
jgi:hypothetical protein